MNGMIDDFKNSEKQHFFVGIDLSGPSNLTDTVLTCFKNKDAGVELIHTIEGAGDRDIQDYCVELNKTGCMWVGLDAPLSYNRGGGLRPADKSLKKRTIAAGLHPGSVMPPTFNRMVYLTLRGISVARSLQGIPDWQGGLVEVHPGATFALRGAAIDGVRGYKKDMAARLELLEWLGRQGMAGVSVDQPSDHYVASCGAALAAWKWQLGASEWLHPAVAPEHPFDFSA